MTELVAISMSPQLPIQSLIDSFLALLLLPLRLVVGLAQGSNPLHTLDPVHFKVSVHIGIFIGQAMINFKLKRTRFIILLFI